MPPLSPSRRYRQRNIQATYRNCNFLVNPGLMILLLYLTRLVLSQPTFVKQRWAHHSSIQTKSYHEPKTRSRRWVKNDVLNVQMSKKLSSVSCRWDAGRELYMFLKESPRPCSSQAADAERSFVLKHCWRLCWLILCQLVTSQTHLR